MVEGVELVEDDSPSYWNTTGLGWPVISHWYPQPPQPLSTTCKVSPTWRVRVRPLSAAVAVTVLGVAAVVVVLVAVVVVVLEVLVAPATVVLTAVVVDVEVVP